MFCIFASLCTKWQDNVNIKITLFLSAAWSIMALVTVLKSYIIIVGPSQGQGLTITMEKFKTVTRAIIYHAARKI